MREMIDYNSKIKKLNKCKSIVKKQISTLIPKMFAVFARITNKKQ